VGTVLEHPTRPREESVRSAPTSALTPTAGRWRARLTWMVAVLALSPFVVGVWSLVRNAHTSAILFGDRAVIALTAADVWRTPILLGPYSRYYWHHPGPAYFYVLGVGSSVFGGTTLGLSLAATVINAAAAVGLLVLAYRRGGRALVCWTAVLLPCYLLAVGPVAFDVWNPSITLLPFALVLMLAWSIACRDWWTAPWLVLAGTFAVQTHVALVPGVMTACGIGAVVGGWRQRRGEGDERARDACRVRRALLVSAVVGFVLWLPPVIQQVTGSDGNLTALARFFLRSGSQHSLSDAVTQTALQLTLFARAVFEPVTLRQDGRQGLVLVAVAGAVGLAVAAWASIRTKNVDGLALLFLVAVEALAGVYSVTRIDGPIQFYLVQWISAVGLVAGVAVGFALIAWARRRATIHLWSRPATRTVAVVLVAFVGLGAGLASARDGQEGNGGVERVAAPDLFGRHAVDGLLTATRGHHDVVLRLDDEGAWEILAADALLLEQHGRDVRILSSPVTRLLFDDALLVDTTAGGTVLAFRVRPDSAFTGAGADARVEAVARQGRWHVARITSGAGAATGE
jgi:hypothetical protein